MSPIYSGAERTAAMLDWLNEDTLCRQLCARVHLHRRADGSVMLDTPFTYPDGDHYPLYLDATATGGVRVSDGGHTLMHLSYENDIDKFLDGTRRLLLDRVVQEQGIEFDAEHGRFFVEAPVDALAEATFRLGQALTRVWDLSYLNRSRVASTFYEDLYEQILTLVPAERIERNAPVRGLPDAENYPVDYLLEGAQGLPLFLFGVPNRDKARLATIFLHHYVQNAIEFDSLIVFEQQEEIPRADLARLTNVGGEMIASLNAEDDFRRKLRRKVA